MSILSSNNAGIYRHIIHKDLYDIGFVKHSSFSFSTETGWDYIGKGNQEILYFVIEENEKKHTYTFSSRCDNGVRMFYIQTINELYIIRDLCNAILAKNDYLTQNIKHIIETTFSFDFIHDNIYRDTITHIQNNIIASQYKDQITFDSEFYKFNINTNLE